MDNEQASIEVRLEIPREMYGKELAAAGKYYAMREPRSLPPDPEAMEAGFIDPVSVIAVLTVAVLAERLLHFALARHGSGVLVDARERPPNVSVLKGVPQGFIVLIHPDGTMEKVRADDPGSDLADLLGKAL